ncbi:hypothetical protein GCM10011494_33230 [Novosphingobium endophyticum]|uniref:Ava_C0101 and related proteins n=1 Tax=Novosphingobium endophyticum TaxID=1955250 RepID=A0A916TXF4_9SPHN|nr:DUF5996 family protein [Novosphingobium endophyticum]GGC11771.1 hypothetical protein GCM10011494_33230 [Novosphingobium endophyticum]
MAMAIAKEAWPDLEYPAWQDTALTLQLWTQIIGKIRLSLTPWRNHGWHVPLYITARGLGTSAISARSATFDIEFDFVDHLLVSRRNSGTVHTIELKPMTVASFYGEVMAAMAALDVPVHINLMPNEVPDPIAFDEDDVHASYDAGAVNRFWQVLVQVDRVFRLFQTGFLGKVSPVHFFWGSFDLAVTRFSGRGAPLHPGGVPRLPDRVTREAYSHEVSSAGFWPGSDAYPQAAFYSYAYPEPPGFHTAKVPEEAAFDETLGEFVLPYAAVCGATNPDALLLDFLSTTYAAAADNGGWDRAALECPLGSPGRPRSV